jgi:uncharacterized protein (TIGR03083 family)
MLGAMNKTADGPADAGYYIDCLRREGELLAAAAERAGLGAAVPACPGWRVRDLLKHLGYVHRWAAGYVGEQRATRAGRASEPEILREGPGDESLAGWFREGHAALVRTLAAAGPDLTCWTFLDAPSPLVFWARRQAHETAIHRVDAEQAAGAAAAGPAGRAPFVPEFAVDGIDELIMGFLGRTAKQGTWAGPQGSVGIHTTDGDRPAAHWLATATPGSFEVSRSADGPAGPPGPAGCEITGHAADLYLLLWNRRDASGLSITGDQRLLMQFREHSKITWA